MSDKNNADSTPSKKVQDSLENEPDKASVSSNEKSVDSTPENASKLDEDTAADVGQSELSEPLNEDTELDDSAHDRRYRYHRLKDIRQLMAKLGYEDKEAVSILMDIDRLMPDAIGMSDALSLEERLSQGDKDLQSSRMDIYQRASKLVDFDSANDVERRFRSNATIEKMIASEEGLLRAIIINDRARHSQLQRVSEHDAANSFLKAELVRRRSIAESWRYAIPKYVLPFVSALHASGIKRDAFKVTSRLFIDMIDVLAQSSHCKVERSVIDDAVQQTEDQFTALLSSQDDPFGALENMESDDLERSAGSRSQHIDEPETMESMSKRASVEMGDASNRMLELDDEDKDQLFALKREMQAASLALSMGGGYDRHGRLVFESGEDFLERLITTGRTNKQDDEAVKLQEHADSEDSAQVSEPSSKNASDAVSADEPEAETLEAGSKSSPDASADLFGSDDTSGKTIAEPAVEPAAEESASDTARPPLELTSSVDIFEKAIVVNGDWPTTFDAPEVVRAESKTSYGFNKSIPSATPFAGWEYTSDPYPFAYMALRSNPIRGFVDGVLEAADSVRPEMPHTDYMAQVRHGRSSVMGLGHELMMLPRSDFEWYGEQLGWQDVQMRKILSFGNPLKPETVRPNGDGELLKQLLRGNAELRLRALANSHDNGFFSSDERLADATEDLARWWAYMLLARHDPDMFEPIFGPGYFHGVEATDMLIDLEKRPVFGNSHFRLVSPKVMELEQAELDGDAGAFARSKYAGHVRRRVPA